MPPDFASLLADILRQGSQPSQQQASFPNFDFETAFSPVPVVESPVTKAFQNGNRLASPRSFNGISEDAFDKTGEDDRPGPGQEFGAEDPAFGAENLPGTVNNFAGLLSSLASATNPVGLMGVLSNGVLNDNAGFGRTGPGGLFDLVGSIFSSPETDFFDFDLSNGPHASPGEFDDFGFNGAAFSSLGLGETEASRAAGFESQAAMDAALSDAFGLADFGFAQPDQGGFGVSDAPSFDSFGDLFGGNEEEDEGIGDTDDLDDDGDPDGDGDDAF